MFTIFKLVLGSLGYLGILAISFFAANPLTITPQPKLHIKDIVNCSATITPQNTLSDLQNLKIPPEVLNSLSSFSDTLMSDFIKNFGSEEEKKAQIEATPAPQENTSLEEFKKQLEFLNQTTNTGTFAGSEICIVSDNTLEDLRSYFKNNEYYQLSTPQELADQLKFLPVTIPSLDLQSNMLIAKSTFCNRPVQNTDIYAFSLVEQQGVKVIMMVNYEIKQKESPNSIERAAYNILHTGQVIKSKVYCSK